MRVLSKNRVIKNRIFFSFVLKKIFKHSLHFKIAIDLMNMQIIGGGVFTGHQYLKGSQLSIRDFLRF